MYKISNGTNYRQLFMLIITFFIGAFFMLIYWFSNNINYIYIFLLFSFIFLIVNVFYSMLFDISISNNRIFVSNLYKKKEVDARQFVEVQFANLFHFPFFIPLFYMSPPYYVFKLKNGKKYFFLNTSSTKAFDSIFSPVNYLNELNEAIKVELKKSCQ